MKKKQAIKKVQPDLMYITGASKKELKAQEKRRRAELKSCADQQVATLKSLVDQQANDPGLWFQAVTASEAYLQQELRRLHELIED